MSQDLQESMVIRHWYLQQVAGYPADPVAKLNFSGANGVQYNVDPNQPMKGMTH
jgi:hypothetical protein